MSARLNATDVALARRLRAVESANDSTIRASADLITTMLDACEARRLPACQGHDTIVRMGTIIADAIKLRSLSLAAHQDVAQLGASLGLPVTAWGDICQMSANNVPLASVEKAA
jgi:hypothetical protein